MVTQAFSGQTGCWARGGEGSLLVVLMGEEPGQLPAQELCTRMTWSPTTTKACA